MRMVGFLLSCPIIAFALLQCAGTRESDPAYIQCRNRCETVFNGCIKKAVKNEAKKAACEAVKNKCLSDCEKK